MTAVRLVAAAKLIVTGAGCWVGVGVGDAVELEQPVRTTANNITNIVNKDTVKLVFLRTVIDIPFLCYSSITKVKDALSTRRL
jgi:hypothetical protein